MLRFRGAWGVNEGGFAVTLKSTARRHRACIFARLDPPIVTHRYPNGVGDACLKFAGNRLAEV